MTRAREISNVLGRNIESTTFTATAGQTAFSITHAAGRIQVYMNGLLLDPTVDWTSDGSTVTLAEGAVAGDELEVVKFDNLAVADAIPRTGHTGTIDFSSATFIPAVDQILQVKHVAWNTTTSTSGSRVYVEVADSAITITAKANNSKFYLTSACNVYQDSSGNGMNTGFYRGTTLIRGTAGISGDTWLGGGNVGTTVKHGSYSIAKQFMDAPNVSAGSSLTYKVAFGKWSAGNAYLNYTGYNGTTCDFTVMEIAQ